MKSLLLLSFLATFTITGDAAIVTLNVSGTYASSSPPALAGTDWFASITYDTSLNPDAQRPFGGPLYYYSTAIQSFQIVSGGDTYVGLNVSSINAFGANLNPPAGIVAALGGGRLDFRGSAFLNGDPDAAELEIFEIVVEDNIGNSLDPIDLPEPGFGGLPSGFSIADIDYTFFATRTPGDSSTFADGLVSNIQFVPEPSTSLLFFFAALTAATLRPRRQNKSEMADAEEAV